MLREKPEVWLLVLVSIHNDVEDVVSAEQHITIVGHELVFFEFGSAFQENVHVAIAFYHFSLVFIAIF